jgi:DNA-binding response OmpR family regulator
MGHSVVGLDCAEALNDELGSKLADLLVIDINLPGEDGLSVAKRMREVQPDIGIIMLTGRSRLEDKIEGYDNGADLYLTKPVASGELNAAVNTLARRLSRLQQSSYDSEKLLLNSRNLTIKGPLGETHLTKAEYVLILSLTKAPGRELEHWQLFEILESEGAPEITKGALEAQTSRLRKKLTNVGAGKALQALRLKGYRLCASVTIV